MNPVESKAGKSTVLLGMEGWQKAKLDWRTPDNEIATTMKHWDPTPGFSEDQDHHLSASTNISQNGMKAVRKN